jgi:MFS family permease
MPLLGRVADVKGRVRVFVACMILFAAASVACGAAQSLEWLIAARMVQAVGGGAALPIALALAAEGRGRVAIALGIVGAVAEAGSVLGPLYGAALVQWVSWRWVFYLNLPITIAIIVLVLRLQRDTPAAGGSVDLRGGILLGAALGALAVGFSTEGVFEAPSAQAILLLLGGLALLALFIASQRQTRDPLIDLKLFRHSPFVAANATNFLVGAVLIVALVNLPLWSATVLQRTAAEGGLLLLRLTLFIPVGAVMGGVVTHFLGPRPASLLGLLACAGSFLLMAQWPATVSDERMALDLALGGLGFGLLLAPLTATAITWAGPARAGVSAALVTLMRMVGMMIGLSALTSYGLGRFDIMVRDLPLPLAMPGETAEALAQRQVEFSTRILEATVAVYHEVFTAAAFLCLLALVPAALLRSPRKPRPD